MSDLTQAMIIKERVKASLIVGKWDARTSTKGKARALRPTVVHFPTILVFQCMFLKERVKDLVRDLVLLVLLLLQGGVGGTPRGRDTPRRGASPRRNSRGRSIDPSKYKIKPCENFAKGTCTFGDRCTFKHND